MALKEDFTQICLALSSNMLYLAEMGTMEACTAMAKEAIKSGKGIQSVRWWSSGRRRFLCEKSLREIYCLAGGI